MLKSHEFCGVFALAGVSLLLQSRPSWAAETTERAVSSTVYAGAGTLTVPNNEVANDEFAVKRLGVGALGVMRFDPAEGDEHARDSGFFAALGATFELEDSVHSVCAFSYSLCGKHYLGKHIGARLGVGYSWRYFEFRVGALAAHPDAGVDYAQPLALPDVMLRVGERSFGWFELGLGAYDASTTLRPGIYLGGALGSPRILQVSAHLGVHLVNGLCCSTVVTAGYRYELSGVHELSSRLSVGAGLALLEGPAEPSDRLVVEGSGHVALAF